jgi:orotidine-5'-phosphate decarboxylase
VGATAPEELVRVREIAGDMPILIPGIGAQGGDVERAVKAGRDRRNRGMIINSSRGIIFASKGDDFAAVARQKTEELQKEINLYLQ